MAVNIAMIGVGAISGIYLENITKTFGGLRLLGVCDLIRERASAAQEKYQVPKLYETMEDAFADPEVDIVLNLTRPYEHFEVTKAALLAGKHVYSEKPLGITFEEGRALYDLAREKGLLLGGAPDTFMGAGIQTCRKLIDDGVIGDVIGSAAFMICHGHETWHPDPEFYYKRGGGPMMDMGPYYITALINLVGGVKAVSGVTRATFPKRVITSAPHRGEIIDVDVPTYVTGTLHYENGAIGTIFTTFDVYYPTQARLEIYGTKGTLIAPDPNYFDGPVSVFSPADGAVKEVPLLFGYRENSRAMGLADMADALENGRDVRPNSDQQLHVLEILTAFEKSSDAGHAIEMTTAYHRGEPMLRDNIPGHVAGLDR